MPDRIGELASMEGYSPQEADFQFGVRATPWFGEFAQQHGEPNLNDPNYDYRAAWAAGARPNVRDTGDNQYHWPSQFKGPEHPNRFVNGVDTITGQPVSTGEEYAGLGGDPSHLATIIKNWWTNQPSWLSRAQAENQKTSEAFQRGGMGEIAKQLATDTNEAQDLYGAFGVGNIKGVRPPLAPGALAATSEYRPPFYSAVEQAVQGAKQNAAPGQQWAGFLRNQPGVKPEEVEALKLGKLFEQPGSVPKEAVLGEIAANRVNVGEVVKGQTEFHELKYRDTLARRLEGFKDLPISDVADVMAARQHNPNFYASTHGKSSSEILKALDEARNFPKIDESNLFRQYDTRQEALDAIRRAGAEGHIEDPLKRIANVDTKFSQYTLPGGENYREMLLTLPEKPRHPNDLAGPSNLFRSSHYDEPNILAHVRYNDRVIDGKKTLFVEEVQSDWHQKGKREGYQGRIDSSQWTADKSGDLWKVKDANGQERFTLLGHEVSSPSEAIAEATRQINASPYGVPDAPFKTTWPELAMKRIIREAAEKGYDKVAWTPGNVQAERYDLSKHIDALHYNPETQRLVATKGDQRILNQNSVKPADLAEIVGKDAAEKLLQQEPSSNGLHSLRGVDLKVGGEGMKGFYDEILPATVNRLVKKHGGRVQQSEINAGGRLLNETESMPGRPADVRRSERGGGYTITLDGSDTTWGLFGDERAARARMSALQEAWDKAKTPVHTIEITPSLRAAAMKGFPLFSAGGVAATGAMGELARQDEYR